jgi:hypothetical protein
MKKKIAALISAFMLALGVGLFAATPAANSHSSSDFQAACTAKLGVQAYYHNALAWHANHTLYVYRNAGFTKFCALNVAVNGMHGVYHGIGVRIWNTGNVEGANTDVGTYAHYAGPVEKNNVTSGVTVQWWDPDANTICQFPVSQPGGGAVNCYTP